MREADRLATRVKAELLLLGKTVAAQADRARRLDLIESVQVSVAAPRSACSP